MWKFVEPTAEQKIEKHYSAMLDSVALIHAVINGAEMSEADPEDKVDAVDRNVRHLQTMLEQDFWTTEDMTPVNAAIAAGTAYIGQ
jgi:hypothetical protein